MKFDHVHLYLSSRPNRRMALYCPRSLKKVKCSSHLSEFRYQQYSTRLSPHLFQETESRVDTFQTISLAFQCGFQ